MDEIDAMSRLLELGGTMLAEHCRRCGAPLFRYQGNVGCPICDFRMVEQEMGEVSKEREDMGATEEKVKPEGGITAGTSLLGKIISDKVARIAADMQSETDLGRIRDQMDCIERGIEILRMLSPD
ncbi:MAG: Sjogren's syndrome/scleroderma autoantigen 1 family protein [Euryarchaeota archaeon]|nr:Sjogren's syndrome/scleroderma autoantigen 1 family protein [Euryarchaeota archaeon]